MEEMTLQPVSTGSLVTQDVSALTSVEQSRAVAEVQAAMVVARMNPRNEPMAISRIMNACKRAGLAETAEYAYKRGGQMVTGPSIRLAEVLARSWGNTTYGFREVGRTEESSEVEAFCWDLETNTKVVRQFQVKHWRDTKQGGYAIKEERDKYELIANMAQRRVRACILEIIPGDVIDDAVQACQATLKSKIGNIEQEVEKIVTAFAGLRTPVSKEEIEAYLQRPVASLVPADIIGLRRIFTSIRDGIAAKEEWFKQAENKPASIASQISHKTAPNFKNSSHEGEGTGGQPIVKPAATESIQSGKPEASQEGVVKEHRLAMDKIFSQKGDPAGTLDQLNVYLQTDLLGDDRLAKASLNELEARIESMMADMRGRLEK